MSSRLDDNSTSCCGLGKFLGARFWDTIRTGMSYFGQVFRKFTEMLVVTRCHVAVLNSRGYEGLLCLL
jgi:hypothetical protein